MKRILDLLLALPAFFLLSPLMLMTAFLIRLKIGSPVLFRQVRPGLYGKPFTLYKFRTMTDKRDEKGNLLPDKDRLTRFGQFLRSSSIDELPELYNIIRGDMSLVGPRPLLMQYLARYSPEQARRHEVRPGLTGWAQVNGRNGLSWEDKFRMDIRYVDNHNIFWDIRIILMTFAKVIKRDGISQPGQVTAEEFLGNTSL